MRAGKPIAEMKRRVPTVVRVRYENGAFTPLDPLDLEEGEEVELTVMKDAPAEPSPEEPGGQKV